MEGSLLAGFWGFVGGVSLLIGAAIGLFAPTSQKVIALVMAVGAGVLISSVAFELMDEAYKIGGFDAASVGLLSGSLLFFIADHIVQKAGGKHRKRSGGQQAEGFAMAIVIGALMDGIPESVAIGVSLVKGEGVGLVMVIAVFLSNIPEALSAATGMKKAGHSKIYVLLLWSGVVLVSALSSMIGYLLHADSSDNIIGGIQAFAAGAILTMLASTMMPEAYEEGGAIVGFVTSVGFLIAFILGKMK